MSDTELADTQGTSGAGSGRPDPIAEVDVAAFAAIFDGMLEGVAVVDREWRFRYLNEAGARNLGASPEELLAASVFDRFPGLRSSPAHSAFRAAAHDRAPRRFEAPLPWPDGSERTLEFSLQPLAAGMLILSRDVTERRALEAGFRASSRSVAAALNASEDSIAIYRPVFDEDGRFIDAEVVFANAATGAWLPDVDVEAARGRRLFDLAPMVRDSVSELYTAVLETGRPVHVVRESQLLASPRVMDITVTPYEGGFVHVARDVTELHRTTAELRRREEELRRIVNGVDAVISWKPDDGPLTVSPQVEAILGWRPDELTSSADWQAHVHPDDLPACRDAWESGEETWSLQYRMRRRDGTYAAVADRGRTYVGADGRGTFSVVVDVSERLAADVALADSEVRLRQIVEGVEAVVAFQAAEGTGLVLSPQIERILLWTPREVPDFETWHGLVHPDDLPGCLAVWDSGDASWELEYRMRRGDGSWAWVLDRGRRVPRSDGSGTVYTIGIIVDATERHRAEEALRRSEELLRRTIEGVDAIVGIQEHAAAPLLCSPQTRRILGIDPAAITSFEDWRAYVHPDDLARCLETWADRPQRWEIEYRMRRPDGRDIWVLDRGRRTPSPDGLGDGTFGIIVDVTDRHHAAEALAASEEQLRRIVEGVDVMISYQEVDGGPIIISPQTERILGYRPEQAAQVEVWRAAIHPDDLPACEAMWASSATGWDMEYRMRRADGAWIWVHDRGRRLPRPDGTRGLFAVITDITAQHEAADRLRASEARFRAMFEENPEAIGVLRPQFAPGGRYRDAEFIAANRTTRERWLGGMPAGLVAGTLASGLWFTGGEDVRAAIAAVAEHGGSWRGEVLTRRDGVEVWTDLSVFPFEDGVAFVGRDVTEQKRADLAVRDSEARFRAVTDSAEDAIVTLDEAGLIVGWNPSAERLFGRSAGEMTGRPITLLMPDAYAPHHTGWAPLGDGAWPIAGHLREMEAMRADGSLFPAELSLADWTVSGRRYATAIIRDVTERRTAEEAVRVANARLRRFLDAGIIGTVVAEVSGRVLEANDYWLNLAGVTREAVDNGEVDWRALTAPGAVDLDERALAEVREHGVSQPFETEYVRPDGRRVPVLVLRTTMPGPGEHMASVVLDMTERHEAAAGLAQLAAFQRSVLDAMAEGMVILAPDGRITSANARAAVILGIDAIDLPQLTPGLGSDMRRDDGTPVPPEDGPGMRTLRTGESCRDLEFNVARGDGARIWLRVNTAPLRDRDGNVIAAVGTFADITAERELAEQLRRSQRLEAIGQLAGGVAHDFNNLLAAIRGYGELAMGSLGQSAPARADLQEVLRAADRAAALTRQLLLFSRREVLAPKLIDPAVVVAGLVPMLSQLVGEHIELVAASDGSGGRVLADPGQLEQVVLNLVVNARDAMPAGGRIDIETRRVLPGAPGDGGRQAGWPAMRMTVADTGAGIDPLVLPRIFEPFFTTKEAGRGSGMGLATVYGIVGVSGGTVAVMSEPGRGTTFTVDLPLVEDDSAAGAAGHGDVPGVGRVDSPPDEPTGAEQGTALLVEDDPAVRAVLARMLGGLGWRVAAFPSGSAAVETVAGGGIAKPDLLVTDVRMPGLQGPDVARRLRATWDRLPVLFVTGLADEVGAEPDEPWMHVLTKPVDIEKLRRAIREAVADR